MFVYIVASGETRLCTCSSGDLCNKGSKTEYMTPAMTSRGVLSTPNPLTVGGWTPYPLMLGGWIQPLIQTFLPKTGFQDIFLISYDAQKAYCAKRSSLRCYSMAPTLFPNVLMALNSHRNCSTLSCWLWVGSTTQYASDQYSLLYWVEYTLPDNCMANLSSARKISSILFTPSSPWETMKKEDQGRLQWHTFWSFINVFPPSNEFGAENIT